MFLWKSELVWHFVIRNNSIYSLIVNARSVVHDSGRLFDRVRERAPISQLDDAARTVSASLRQTLACLPDNAVIERAIEQVRGAQVTQQEPVDLRVAATKLIESSSELVVRVRAPQQAGNVDVFVRSYTDFHTAVVQQIQVIIHGITTDTLPKFRPNRKRRFANSLRKTCSPLKTMQ